MDQKTLALLELSLLACIGVGLAFAWDKPIFTGIFAGQAALAFWQAVRLSMHK